MPKEGSLLHMLSPELSPRGCGGGSQQLHIETEAPTPSFPHVFYLNMNLVSTTIFKTRRNYWKWPTVDKGYNTNYLMPSSTVGGME